MKNLSKRAFTLLEVAITTILITVGITSLFSSISTALAGDRHVRNNITALNLAKEQLELVHDAASYVAIDGFASAKTYLTGDYSAFQREVTVDSDPKRVNVIVYWDTSHGETSLSLSSLFADYDY